jgi:selenocysteine lyase/cysteine desulfurase
MPRGIDRADAAAREREPGVFSHNTRMSRAPIYLDCHATTPVDRRVLDAMLPFFTEDFGNAAS